MNYNPKRIAQCFSPPIMGPEFYGEVQEVRKAGYQLAAEILHHTPSCPEQTTAINKVREAIMYANEAALMGAG